MKQLTLFTKIDNSPRYQTNLDGWLKSQEDYSKAHRHHRATRRALAILGVQTKIILRMEVAAKESQPHCPKCGKFKKRRRPMVTA